MKWYLRIFIFTLGITGICAAHVAWSALVDTGVTTTEPITVPLLTQSSFRWYENIDALTPTDAFANQDAATSTPSQNTVLRLRMGIEVSGGVTLDAGTTFKLQFSQSATSGWADVATSTAWIFSDNSGVSDGQVISATLLSQSDVGESYSESNPSAASPNAIGVGEQGEWDWVIQNDSASQGIPWFFRMLYASGTLLDTYSSYPSLIAASLAATTTATSTSLGPGGGGNTGFNPYPPVLTEPGPKFPPSPPWILYSCDFNGDNKCNIVDLSIMLYYFDRTGSAIARYDLSGNGTVDLPDVSILMYYWVD